ncbi:AtpZ/AtpI family protein [Nitrospina watsonii]|uniref:ATP synthase F0, subunit I n=1 Tax=Nitrospina watsonii TaxID=1323948 RepID=A0ABN8W1F1_9BACT|nr:AtpZ/AtpI family protein [Nitrospina watsonii]CAI2718061.1 putative ATP synthase F0, subunit I [Nitrospina watsonii]
MKSGSPLRQGLSYAFRLGTEMTVATLIGALMGYALDYYLGTDPWFLALGVLFGGAAGCLNVYRAGMAMEQDWGEDAPKNDNDDHPDSDDDPPDPNHDIQK